MHDTPPPPTPPDATSAPHLVHGRWRVQLAAASLLSQYGGIGAVYRLVMLEQEARAAGVPEAGAVDRAVTKLVERRGRRYARRAILKAHRSLRGLERAQGRARTRPASAAAAPEGEATR